MADQVASLVVEVDASGAKKAAVDLDTLAKAADRADNAANDLADSSRKLSAAEQTVANEAKRAMEGVSHLAAEQEAAVKTAQRLNAAHGSAVISSKALNQATLNLGRQFVDIGTSLGSGMSPLMVLIQQGPQITDIFAQLKTQGIGAGAAFQAMGASLAPALPLILGIGAAVGVVVGAFALFERAVDKETKHATTFGDTWKATLKVTGDYIMDGPIGDGLKWLGKAFNTTLDVITGVVAGGAVKIAGFFGASYLAVVNNWKRLPEVVGVILQNAANAAIKATEWLINRGIDGINALGKNFGFAQIGKVALGTFKSASLDIAKQFDADQKRIEASVTKGMSEFLGKVAAEADKNYERRQKGAKATQKAVEDHTKAIKLNTDTVAAANVVDLEALRIAAAFEKQQKSLKTAANDNIRAFDAAGVTIPTALENMATEAERVAYQTRDIVYGVEDIADAINRNDWTSAFSSLARVLVQVQNAFKQGTDSATKFNAVAALAQGVGNVVGGSTGSAISGAASGFLAGNAILPGIGGVIGGGLGLVSSLFGSSKAKKQQRAQEAAQRAAEEAARQQQISDTTFSLNVALLEAQGKAEEALAMTRQRELDALAKLDPALVSLQQQLYAAEDAASAAAKAQALAAQARDLDIQLMEATGNVAGALAARREIEVAALDESLRATQLAIYAANDLSASRAEEARVAQEAAQKAEARAAEVASAQASIQDRIDALTMTSAELMYAGRRKELDAADALDASLGPLLVKLYGLEDAASAAAKAAEEAAAAEALREEAVQRSLAFQQTNIGLMRQLMAMDDAVTGGNSALLAMREDELAKLDDTGKYLQRIIWAREDEQKIIDANVAKMEAAAARAAELASRQGSIQDQIDQLTLSSADLLLKTRAKERAEAVAFDASLGGLLDSLYSLQDASKAASAAMEAEAERIARAKEVADYQASIQDRIDELTLSSSDLLLKTRNKETAAAAAYGEAAVQLLRQLYALEDASKAAAAAAQAQAEAQQAAAEAQRQAEEVAQRAAELQSARQAKLADLLDAQGQGEAARMLRRAQELASITDPVLNALQQQLYIAEDAAQRVSSARDVLTKAYEREQSALTDTKAKFADMAKTLREFSGSITSAAIAASNPFAQRSAAEAAFVSAANRARLGDTEAMALLPSLGAAFREASLASAKDQIAYLRDLATIANLTDAAAETATRQETIAEQQLKALKSQVSGLIDVEEATVDVTTAVDELKAALVAQATGANVTQIAALNEQLSALWDLNKLIALVDGSVKASGVSTTQALVTIGAQQVTALANLASIGNNIVSAINSLSTVFATSTASAPRGAVTIAANDDADTAAAKALYLSATSGIDVATFNKYLGSTISEQSAAFNRIGWNGDPEALRKKYGFATGGSFTVGGSGPPDSQVFPLHLSPGEMVNVSRPGESGNAEMVAELRALRQEVAELKAAQIQTTINTGRQVRLAERWDGDGLPPERTAA